MSLLPTVEKETGAAPAASVIWLHGLGADGRDFEPIIPQLSMGLPIRFVFPHAPVRPVTLNGGMPMRAWFDITDMDRNTSVDMQGIEDSCLEIVKLIEREIERGVLCENIIVAGFSQGGTVALRTALRYPQKLAGVMGLSTYIPQRDYLAREISDANRDTPVFLAHGSMDPMVPPLAGDEGRRWLLSQDYTVEWHSYPMSHTVCPEEIGDIRQWLMWVLDAGE